MDCEIICNVDVPSAYIGLRILLVDPDPTSLSNITAILEEHSFKGTFYISFSFLSYVLEPFP